ERWFPKSYGSWEKKFVDDPNLTAYVARALAENKNSSSAKSPELDKSLTLGMNFLESSIDSWPDAYLVGNYAIAAMMSGREGRISQARSYMASLAHREGATTYWNLEANTTPFYGWGGAGRMETTALAVKALVLCRSRTASADSEEIDRGLQYLLSHKDRYAMWYSTQATENALEAILAVMPDSVEPDRESEASVAINDGPRSAVRLPASQTLTGPIAVDFDKELLVGTNRLQIRRNGPGAAMNVVVLVSYYVPPGDAPATSEDNLLNGDKRALRLKVQFDRTDISLKDAVTCHVEAERIGFRGYGMMIAEVGLPPGADVDRDSLEKGKEEGIFQSYEVLPEKVLFYLWPQAGGSQFQFRFHLR